MGLGSFVDINIFAMKYYLILVSLYFPFFKSLKSKSTQLLRSQKGNSGVSFKDTLLFFFSGSGGMIVSHLCAQLGVMYTDNCLLLMIHYIGFA